MHGSYGGGGRGQVVQTSRLKIFNLPIIDLRTPHPWNHNYPLAPLPPLHDPHMSTDNSMKKKIMIGMLHGFNMVGVEQNKRITIKSVKWAILMFEIFE